MEAEECCLNPKDFITFKTEIDLLCNDDMDVFKRWGILEDIQKTKVLQHDNLHEIVSVNHKVQCYRVLKAPFH